jgi:hypothetical protein
MINDEAKFILSAYRPNGCDAGDAQFATALEQARHDPALGAWLARSQAHDTAVAAKLGAITPPPGLREAILAGARASQTGTVTRRRWSLPWTIAAAAAVAVGIAGAVWQGGRSGMSVEQLADSTLDDMWHAQHGGHGAPAAELQRWLDSPDSKLAAAPMPVDFDKLRQTGCRTLAVSGRQLLEICFSRGGSEFHVYIMPQAEMPGLPARRTPTVLARAGGGAAVWSDGHYAYSLVSSAGPDAIRRLL